MRLSRAGLALVVAVAACQAGTDANPIDLNGRWEFTETFADFLHGISCADTGTYEITQQGDRFSGHYAQRGLCHTPTGNVDNSDSGSVAGGRVVGHTLSFMVTANCQYQGNASGMPARQLSGLGVCVLLNGSDTLRFNGTWQASR